MCEKSSEIGKSLQRKKHGRKNSMLCLGRREKGPSLVDCLKELDGCISKVNQ